MVPALITSITGLIVAVIVTVGQFLSARNDRALAHQEVDLLKKLQSGSQAAADLEMIINKRIDRWRAKYEGSISAANRSRNFLGIAAVTLILAIPMLFYLKPQEAWGGLSDLVVTMIYILVGGTVVAVLGAIAYLVLSVVLAYKETRERRRRRDGRQTTSPDQSLAGTGPADSSNRPSAHSPNGSSERATARSHEAKP